MAKSNKPGIAALTIGIFGILLPIVAFFLVAGFKDFLIDMIIVALVSLLGMALGIAGILLAAKERRIRKTKISILAIIVGIISIAINLILFLFAILVLIQISRGIMARYPVVLDPL